MENIRQSRVSTWLICPPHAHLTISCHGSNWWDVLYMQVGVTPQSMACSVLYTLITSSEDKSSANFPGISVCDMCTALRRRLSSGESPGSSHPRGRRFKHRDTSQESRVLDTWQQIGVWGSAAQCQCHFMGNSCEHMVASVCEKVMRERERSQAGSSFYCQGQKPMMNYEIAILHQNEATWVGAHICFSLRKKAICWLYVLLIKIPKAKMQGRHLLGYLWLLGVKLSHLGKDAVDSLNSDV